MREQTIESGLTDAPHASGLTETLDPRSGLTDVRRTAIKRDRRVYVREGEKIAEGGSIREAADLLTRRE